MISKSCPLRYSGLLSQSASQPVLALESVSQDTTVLDSTLDQTPLSGSYSIRTISTQTNILLILCRWILYLHVHSNNTTPHKLYTRDILLQEMLVQSTFKPGSENHAKFISRAALKVGADHLDQSNPTTVCLHKLAFRSSKSFISMFENR
jgi:hypothetical protein